jgi:YaiO family outer membrane protein
MRLLLTTAGIFALFAVCDPATAQADTDQRAKAQALYLAGDHAGAQAILEGLLAERPGDADLLRRLANVQAARGDSPAAMQTIDRAMAIAPDDLDIQLARANILLWLGRHLEARRQAEAISRAQADYPGLSETLAAIGRQEDVDRIRLFAAGIGGSVSHVRFPGRDAESWTTANGSIAASLGPRLRAALEAEREDRGPIDTRLSARFDLLRTGGSAYLAGSVTPDADFRESWSFGAGGEQSIQQRTTLLLDARYASYRFDEIGVLGLGVRQDVGRNLAATVRTIHLVGSGQGYRFGASMRLDYAPKMGVGWFVAGAKYPDTETDGTAEVRALSAGTGIPLTDGLMLRLAAEYEKRAHSYERSTFSVGLAWRFGPR